MYQDRHSNAIYALNSYVWKLLEVNLGWNISDYKQGRPILPAAQQPEFTNVGKTFLVYNSAINPSIYPLRSETMAYTIYSPSTTAADAVVNLLTDAFEREDEAATDVNDWLDIERNGVLASDQEDPNLRRVSFQSVRSTMGEKSNPPDQEGGWYSAVVMIDLMYNDHGDTGIQTRGFTYP